MKPLIAVTMGDPTGVGPEIIAQALSRQDVGASCRVIVLGDEAVMARALEITGVPLKLDTLPEGGMPADNSPGLLHLLPLTRLGAGDIEFGRPTPAGGDAMFRYIAAAARLCLSGEAAAMATAPISKAGLNLAGHHYPGHTELLGELTGTRDYVMMLAGDRLRVALVTIHEALADVPGLISREKVLATIRITHGDVSRYFRPDPRIAVLALNPHCGEGGLFGDEETRFIGPAIAAARQEGIDAVGPLSADTLFHFAARGEYDAVVCMYHDQGLIPLKLLHFEDGVNVTLGLPIIRTSVDHGTAYDLAGTGRASAASMAAAIRMAAEMAGVKAQGMRH
jgi:4-hydroxythreonine-4-phosphate dehydrogenase